MFTKSSKHYGYFKLVVGACREWIRTTLAVAAGLTAGVAVANVSKQSVCSKTTINISSVKQLTPRTHTIQPG